MDKFKLNNGQEIPAIGLGTFPMKRFELVKAMRYAVNAGYRSFDTSNAYANERAVGYGIKFSSAKRDELFVTTKLSNPQQREKNVLASIKKSLKLLKLDYVDMYLMHWPHPGTFLENWIQMEEVYRQGYAKSIGVCNFHEHHLRELLEIASVIPAVNQIELHPLLNQNSLVDYCRSKDIIIQAYSPLARMNKKLVENPELLVMATKYNKSVVQIILRWNYQRGIIAIPKSKSRNRLQSNIDIFDFELSYQDMITINSLDCNYRVRHNPDTCDYTKI